MSTGFASATCLYITEQSAGCAAMYKADQRSSLGQEVVGAAVQHSSSEPDELYLRRQRHQRSTRALKVKGTRSCIFSRRHLCLTTVRTILVKFIFQQRREKTKCFPRVCIFNGPSARLRKSYF